MNSGATRKSTQWRKQRLQLSNSLHLRGHPSFSRYKGGPGISPSISNTSLVSGNSCGLSIVSISITVVESSCAVVVGDRGECSASSPTTVVPVPGLAVLGDMMSRDDFPTGALCAIVGATESDFESLSAPPPFSPAAANFCACRLLRRRQRRINASSASTSVPATDPTAIAIVVPTEIPPPPPSKDPVSAPSVLVAVAVAVAVAIESLPVCAPVPVVATVSPLDPVAVAPVNVAPGTVGSVSKILKSELAQRTCTAYTSASCDVG
ncbi:hypothetical protein CSAL01_08131 [Colletotrichum salicis]|uniref:Uncharacterized protein n=1 Tax=Colletotrichum salicis TaxID=1209931 RepID=A0A135UXN8_9PEZI|nr:hypothetical protein CSAL01_08131 [Colletotrichum salicis]